MLPWNWTTLTRNILYFCAKKLSIAFLEHKGLMFWFVRLQIINPKNGRSELWALTSSFQKFMTDSLHSNETNFRILAGYVDELIRGTKCNGVSPRALHNNNFKSLQFAKWRLWHREEFGSPRFQTLSSVQWRKYPNSFAERRPMLHFSKFFTRPSPLPFSWVIRSSYDLKPADYTVFIDHDWGTRDATCTLPPLVTAAENIEST